jgi:hypothetical protein
VIQIRKCGSTTLFGTSIDGSIGGPGVVFGNRYGSISSCTATSQSATNNEYVPIVRIDYLEENNLAVTQSGPGVGDLTVILTMLSPTGVEGWTLTSGTTTMGPPGSGPFIGLWPDSLTWQLIAIPYAPGNPFHFRATDPGVFPQTPLVVPPGTMSGLAGVNLDFVVVMLNAASQYDSRSNLVRHLFQ